jgi:hypothetical protein
MADFFIGGTNFGIDAGKSRLDLASGPGGHLLLTVDVHGSQEVYDRLKADEESEWSWTLYPPHFYLHGYPVPAPAKGQAITVKLKPADADKYDVALYLMEHNDVKNVTLRVAAGQIEVSGRVDLMGDRRDFRIRWARP